VVNYLQTILERWASSVSSCLLIERVNCVDAGSVGSFSVCSGHRSVQRCVARCRQKRRITRRAAVCSSRVRSAPLICRSHPCGYDAHPPPASTSSCPCFSVWDMLFVSIRPRSGQLLQHIGLPE